MQRRQRTRLPRELSLRLLDVIQIQVDIAKGVDEFRGSRPQTWATIMVNMAYEAILNGTPRKTSALRW